MFLLTHLVSLSAAISGDFNQNVVLGNNIQLIQGEVVESSSSSSSSSAPSSSPSSSNVSPPPPTAGTVVGSRRSMNDKCFGDTPTEDVGTFPSPLDTAAGITWFTSSTYLFTHETPVSPGEYPHRDGYPPFSQLCTSFQAILREVFEEGKACAIDGDIWPTIRTHISNNFQHFGGPDTTCSIVEKMVYVFTLVLQAEYYFATQYTKAGAAWAESILFSQHVGDYAFEGPEQGWYTFMYQMQDKLDQDKSTGLSGTGQPLTMNDWVYIQQFIYGSITSGLFGGHVETIRESARPTASATFAGYSATFPVTLVVMQEYGEYPEHFETCLVSRRMYDYMNQNPTKRFDGINSLDNEFRCFPLGQQLLYVQSEILKHEKNLGSSNPQLSGKIACGQVKALIPGLTKSGADAVARTSEHILGGSCWLAKNAADCEKTSFSRTAFTMLAPGHDGDFMYSHWITFLRAHMSGIESLCQAKDASFVLDNIHDPLDRTNVKLTVSDLLARELAQVSLFPQYIDTMQLPSDAPYIWSNRVYNSSALESAGVTYDFTSNGYPPHETRETLALPLAPRTLLTMEEGVAQGVIFAQELENDCTIDDPVYRFRNFANTPVEQENMMGLILSIQSVFTAALQEVGELIPTEMGGPYNSMGWADPACGFCSSGALFGFNYPTAGPIDQRLPVNPGIFLTPNMTVLTPGALANNGQPIMIPTPPEFGPLFGPTMPLTENALMVQLMNAPTPVEDENGNIVGVEFGRAYSLEFGFNMTTGGGIKLLLPKYCNTVCPQIMSYICTQ